MGHNAPMWIRRVGWERVLGIRPSSGGRGGSREGIQELLCRDVVVMVRYLEDSGQVPYLLVKFAISRFKDRTLEKGLLLSRPCKILAFMICFSLTGLRFC